MHCLSFPADIYADCGASQMLLAQFQAKSFAPSMLAAYTISPVLFKWALALLSMEVSLCS